MNLLDKYLSIEDNLDLYKFRLPSHDILLYPIIRSYLLESAIEDSYNICPYDKIKPSKWTLIKYIFVSFRYRPQKAKQSDIVFFGADIANISSEKGYFNRLTETFANEYPGKTALIERADKWKYKRPRIYDKVYAKDFIHIIARLKSLMNSANQEDLNQIELFMRFLKENFPHHFQNDSVWDNIKMQLIRFAKNLPYALEEYAKLLKRISPKIVFVDCACYGSTSLPIIITAKKMKIPVGEYQHGLISFGHPAYNYSVHLDASYLKYMPEFFLCYGKYWKDNSRIPINVIEIGNPFLSETLSKSNLSIQKKKVILYISSALTPELYVREVLWLHENSQKIGYSILFRIHPSEIERLKGVYKPILDVGIEIDKNPLYETLSVAEYLIGDISTVLFEAIPFNCIVFIRESLYVTSNMDVTKFNVFTDLQDILDNIKQGTYQHPILEDLWADSWRTRYRNFIEQYIGQ